MGLSNISYTITSGQIGGGFPIDLAYGTIELFPDDTRSHDSQLVLTRTSIATGATATLVSGVDYVITAAMTKAEMQAVSALEEGDIVIIQRVTQDTSRIFEFTDSAALSAVDLNSSAQQNFFLAQETRDAVSSVVSADAADRWDGQNKNSINFPTPSTSTSLVNKAYVDAAVAGLDPATIDNASQWDFLGSDLTTDTFDMTPGNATIGGVLPENMDFAQFLVDVDGVKYKGVTVVANNREFSVTGLVGGYRITFNTGDVVGAEIVTVSAISGTINTTVGDGTITTDALASSSVTEPKIATDAVTNDKVAIGLDASKITVGEMSGSRIVDNTIPDAKISDLSGSKLTGTSNVSGNILIDNTVADDKIISLNGAKLAALSVTDAKIVEMNGSKLTSATVTDAKIVGMDGAKLTAGTVDTVQLADGGVTEAKLASGVAGLKFDTFIEPTTTLASLNVTPTLTLWDNIITGNPASGTQLTTGDFITAINAAESLSDRVFRNETDQVIHVFGSFAPTSSSASVEARLRNENWDASFTVQRAETEVSVDTSLSFMVPPGYSFVLRAFGSGNPVYTIYGVVLK